MVVLGYALWQRRFGGEPGVVGATVRDDGVTRTVVGVPPRDLRLGAVALLLLLASVNVANLLLVRAEVLARVAWPGESAIGKRFRLGGGGEMTFPWMQVMGVAGDVRSELLGSAARPMYYMLGSQFAPMVGGSDPTMTVVVRTAGDPRSLAAAARQAVWSLDPDVAVPTVRTLAEVTSGAVSRARCRGRGSRRWCCSPPRSARATSRRSTRRAPTRSADLPSGRNRSVSFDGPMKPRSTAPAAARSRPPSSIPHPQSTS